METNSDADPSNEAYVNGERLDPAPDPIQLAHNAAEQLMDNLTNHALNELRKLRDEIDGLMIALTRRHKHIIGGISDHASDVGGILQSQPIMAEHVQKMKEMFAPVQAVMTQGDRR